MPDVIQVIIIIIAVAFVVIALVNYSGKAFSKALQKDLDRTLEEYKFHPVCRSCGEDFVESNFTPGRCSHCGSLRSKNCSYCGERLIESKYHPGHCLKCGGPI